MSEWRDRQLVSEYKSKCADAGQIHTKIVDLENRLNKLEQSHSALKKQFIELLRHYFKFDSSSGES